MLRRTSVQIAEQHITSLKDFTHLFIRAAMVRVMLEAEGSKSGLDDSDGPVTIPVPVDAACHEAFIAAETSRWPPLRTIPPAP